MKFELNFLPKNATDEDIFEEIRRIDSLVGKAILTRTDYDKYRYQIQQIFYRDD